MEKDINIGDTVLDEFTGKKETVVDMRDANVEGGFNVTQTKTSDKGIDSTQWFGEKEFKKRFTLS